jgi:hypothetical protein
MHHQVTLETVSKESSELGDVRINKAETARLSGKKCVDSVATVLVLKLI